jgi:hypothetical protein
LIHVDFEVRCDHCKQVAFKMINQARKDQNQVRLAQLAFDWGWGYRSGSGGTEWFCHRCVPRVQAEGVRVVLPSVEE